MPVRKDKVILVLIIPSVFLFLFLSGTISSGFHFVDDHEVITIKYELKSSSLIKVTNSWVKKDLTVNNRFRPLYYIHRVLETKLLGSDFILWSIYNGVLCCLTLIYSYLGMRNLKFNMNESLIFLVIAITGTQSSIWWRLGPGESLAMVFLGLSFYFMSKAQDNEHYLINNVLFVFFLVLCSLTKESFLIIIPGMVYLKIWYEKIYIWRSFNKSLIKNSFLIVPLIVMIAEMLFINYYVGTSYAELDTNLIAITYRIFFNSLYFLKQYLNFIIICLFLFSVSWVSKKRIIEFNLFSICFFILVFIPNLILYSKSGLVERYLLPTTFGLGFLVAALIKGIEEKSGWLKKIVLFMVAVSFIPILLRSYNEAINFTQDGIAINKLLSGISNSYTKGTELLIVADPIESYENSVSLKSYLFYENSIDIFGFPMIDTADTKDFQSYLNGWKSYFNGRYFKDMTSKPDLIVLFDNNMIDEFFKRSTLLRQNYSSLEIGKSSFALLKQVH
jgi:hypothetical protein